MGGNIFIEAHRYWEGKNQLYVSSVAPLLLRKVSFLLRKTSKSLLRRGREDFCTQTPNEGGKEESAVGEDSLPNKKIGQKKRRNLTKRGRISYKMREKRARELKSVEEQLLDKTTKSFRGLVSNGRKGKG